jgi:protein phosphatase
MHRKGRLTEREARNHPGRSSLQQALGANNQHVDPHIGAVGYQAGDRFLICSDGLIDGLWNRRINEFLSTPGTIENLAGLMVEEAVDNSGKDNTTAVVIEIVPEST